MARKSRQSTQIQDFIIYNVEKHSADIGRVTAEKFGLSRVAAVNHLRSLVRAGLLTAIGQTKARRYALKPLAYEQKILEVTPDLQEHDVWLTIVKPHLTEVKENVLGICAHGFTEMFNNVIDHSESKTAKINVYRDAANINLEVQDYGVGIFNKIQKAFNLSEPQHAILELTKGKITTNKEKHTGEGIFFTSRMFDLFAITSGTLVFSRSRNTDDWIFESDSAPVRGTKINMSILINATHTTKEIFDKYRTEFDEFGFSKTIIPLVLMKYEGEQLISRSQAKRLMAHVDQFREVVLDFKGITSIGQAFADEVFRVYRREHSGVNVYPVNMTDEVIRMIQRIVVENPTDSLNPYLEKSLSVQNT